ncbi:MAG: hypothetical protein ACN4GM_03605 [Gammaproteobacteria bacterium]
MAEDYKIIHRDSEQSVRLAFKSEFEGREVMWNARIRTLYACHLQLTAAATANKQDKQAQKLCQFIDIRFCDGVYLLDIGLNLAQIDKPAIKRAIIMIRKYKRLHLGRHEYGEAIQFDAETG